MQRQPIEIRFWSKVEKRGPEECWPWKACKNAQGYGDFHTRGMAKTKAHRFAYFLEHGKLPKALLVCHHCDNPSCCNPSHLFLGTKQDNMDDSMEKGRMQKTRPRGEKHGMARLTNTDVIAIRKRYAEGNITYKELANLSGIPKGTLYHLVSRTTWTHI